jgi:hypothetical protein
LPTWLGLPLKGFVFTGYQRLSVSNNCFNAILTKKSYTILLDATTATPETKITSKTN